MSFRHLLEWHNLARTIFDEVARWQPDAGVLLKEGSLIEASSSTKNKSGARDPEMHQTKKGNLWHFGMKAHIGVGARTGITDSLTTTPANVHHGHWLHGEESFVFADSGYRGAEQREVLKECKVGLVYPHHP
jgi:IS5 family transposase